MASTCFEYTPLSSSCYFRLLRIRKSSHSRDPTNHLEIDLFEVPFENPPAFEAVSYAWDHADVRATLLCNGQQLHVSPVVVDMINALSCLSTIGVFWIDAVCIDQSSVSDKNTQVPRMRSIFSEAQRVWIWLGKGSYESRIAFEFLAEMDGLWPIKAGGTNVKLAKKWRTCLQKYQDTVREHRGVYDAVDTDFIVDIINLPWFHRTWTIQEVALARSATLVCGPKSLGWSSFLEVLKQLQSSQNTEAAVNPEEPSLTTLSNPATFFDDIRTHSMMTDVAIHRKSLPLSRAFDLICQKNSSDPKDKVYGLYGIFDHLQVGKLPPVDYTGSVQKLYYETTQAIIENDRKLHILYLIGLQPIIPGLPSWVPDYSNTDFIRFIDVYGNDASARSPTSFEFNISNLSLTVQGMLLDEVDARALSTSICTPNFRRGFIARSNLSNPKERHKAVTELVRTLRAWVELSRTIKSYPTGETPSKAFYKIMTQPIRPGSQNWTMPVVPTTAWDVFERWLSTVTAELGEDGAQFYVELSEIQSNPESVAIVEDYVRLFGCSQEPKEWSNELQIRLLLRARDQALSTLQHDVSLLSYQRAFFTTKNGYMGIGPRATRPTDRIALISGLQLPFIIRMTGSSYKLVGPAYIHGIMKGERWNRGLAEDIVLV